MPVDKWDYKKHEYNPYTLPGPHTPLMTDDMDEEINCAGCGKKMRYGDSFTSRTIHTSIGLGYPVCDKCYEEEFEAERAAKE